MSNSTLKNLTSSLPESQLSGLKSLAQKRKIKLQLEASQTAFTKFFFRARGERFIPAEHHERIEEVLTKIENGELYNEDGEKCTIVVINIAPRFGKTQFTMIDWMARCLALNSRAKFIHLSYSDELALDNSEKCKEIVKSPKYQDFWDTRIKTSTDSKKKWYTEEGGGVYATAAGGQVTGFGAGSLADIDAEIEDEFEEFFAGEDDEDQDPDLFYGAILIDDPIKVDDADNETARNAVNNRLINTVMSRRNSRNTPIVIAMQRLHGEDMSGFVLAGGTGEPVYHLNLQSLIEIPEMRGRDDVPEEEKYRSLWSEKHTVQELLNMKKTKRRFFNTQHQQDPAPDTGTFFDIGMIKRFRLGEEPTKLVKYGAGDFAVTEDDGDWTELGIGAFDFKEDLWFLDWYEGQVRLDKGVGKLFDMHIIHDPVLWAAEKGQIRRASEGYFEQNHRARRVYFKKEWMAATKSKAVNAKAFQALIEEGKVHIPYGDWGEDLIEQLTKFTGKDDKRDDKVDVCGIFGRLLSMDVGPDQYHEELTSKEVDDDYGYDDDYDDEYSGGGNIPVI